MARKPRIHYPGACYHVMLRGNGGMDIFDDDQDRSRFFLFLQEGIERFGYRVFAYCLMDNHIHLAVQVGEIPLSRAMQNLSFRYTRWHNWRNKRSGHLFQGRYKAILVEADDYLLQLVAYLHLNPVRAGMVNLPLEYPWSSHCAYMGKESIPWLEREAILSRLSGARPAAQASFASLVSDQASLGHRKEFHGVGSLDTRILGDDRFLNQVLQRAEQQPATRPDLEMCIRLVTNHFGCESEILRQAGRKRQASRVRAYLAWLVLEHSSSNLTELGRWMNREVSTLSSAVSRLHERATGQGEVRTDLEGLKTLLGNIETLQA